jgi:hypothetical protein
VAFTSTALNLVPGDTNFAWDVFVHDLQTGATTRVSVDSSGAEGDGLSMIPSISSDGRYVAFTSLATNLVPGDTNAAYDVFVHDRQTGATTRVSVDSAGVQGDGDSGWADLSLSADGRFVAFESLAANLVPGDTNGVKDVFLHDLQTGATTRLSVDSNAGQGDAESRACSISASGRYVAFQSEATNLVPGDANALRDVFLRDRGDASAFTPFCLGDGSGLACPCANSGAPGHGCENSAVTGGALLSATGVASLSADTVQLSASDELPTALSIVLQGDVALAPLGFGDGLRCAGGSLKRLYARNAVGGVLTAPQTGDPSISARSAALGAPIPLGATRIYQVYYRDPSASFCPAPTGSTFNVSGATAVAWGG